MTDSVTLPPPKISVVMPTRNRAIHLPDALARCERIATALPWELVVVDNGSTDDTQDVLHRFAARTSLRLVVCAEPRKGASHARNTGWQNAGGEIVAFIDDDCYPAPDFVACVHACFAEQESLGYIGGRILLYDSTDYPITIQTCETREVIAPGSFVPAGLIHSANMAVRMRVLRATGGFDGDLGAGTPFSCEDVDFVSRASAAGFEGAYDPRPLVYHHHRRRTQEEADALMRSYDIGRGAYYMKCLLDPARRRQAAKNWRWTVLRRLQRLFAQPRNAAALLYELQGALRYLGKRSIRRSVA